MGKDIKDFSASAGEKFYLVAVKHSSGGQISCATCHTDDCSDQIWFNWSTVGAGLATISAAVRPSTRVSSASTSAHHACEFDQRHADRTRRSSAWRVTPQKRAHDAALP